MKHRQSAAAFTLTELIVAGGVGAAMMAALLAGAVALQRGFAAAEHQIISQEDQMRALDYVMRDVRSASAVAVVNTGRKLILTIPEYVNPTTLQPRTPVISGGIVKYGGFPRLVSYSVEGNAFIRRENMSSEVLSTNIEEFRVFAGNLPEVTCTVAFVPRFSRPEDRLQALGPRVSATACLRNADGSLQ